MVKRAKPSERLQFHRLANMRFTCVTTQAADEGLGIHDARGFGAGTPSFMFPLQRRFVDSPVVQEILISGLFSRNQTGKGGCERHFSLAPQRTAVEW